MASEKPRKAAVSGSNGAGGQRVLPAPPGDLEAAGLEVWETCWTLPRIEPADCAMVEQLCRLTDEAARLRAVLAQDGMTLRTPVLSPKGGVVGERVVIHPAVAMLRRIGRESAEVASELGLSPGGRRRLGLEMAPEPLEPDGVDELRKQIARRRGEPDPGVDGRRRW